MCGRFALFALASDISELFGATSPFAIDLDSLTISFQLRSGTIKRTSFTGAFEGLLNEASSVEGWGVAPLLDETSFAAWRSRVDRITEIKLRIERPNPNYGQRHQLRELVEGTRAYLVNLDAKAIPDDPVGINIEEELIAEAIEHAEAVPEQDEEPDDHPGGETQDEQSLERRLPPQQSPQIAQRMDVLDEEGKERVHGEGGWLRVNH